MDLLTNTVHAELTGIIIARSYPTGTIHAGTYAFIQTVDKYYYPCTDHE